VLLSAYSSAVLADHPGLYYRLGDTATTAAHDSSGNGYDGTYSGAVALGQPSAIRSDPDTAIALAGTAGMVQGPNPSALKLASQGTLECWISPDPTLTSTSRFLTQSDQNVFWIGVNPATGDIAANVYDGTANRIADSGVRAASLVGSWTQVVGTFDSANVRIYINSTLKATAAAGPAYYGDTSYALVVGAYGDGSGGYYKGGLDEAALYAAALSAAQIQTHYNAVPLGAITPAPSHTLDAGTLPTNVDESEMMTAIDPTNPLNRAIAVSQGEFQIIAYTSADGGNTWQPSQFNVDGTEMTYIGAQDPGIAYDANGTLFLSFLGQLGPAGGLWDTYAPNGINVIESIDKGRTFGPVQNFGGNNGGRDKDMIATGRDPTTGKQAVYVAFNGGAGLTVSGGLDDGSGSLVSITRDVAVDPALIADVAAPVVGNAGQLYLISGGGIPTRQNSIYFARALSWQWGVGGTFSTPVTAYTSRIPTTYPFVPPASPNHGILVGYGTADIDRSAGPYAGTLYVAFIEPSSSAFALLPHPDPNPFTSVEVIGCPNPDSSQPTWSQPAQVDPANAATTQFNPWVSVDPITGTVGVSYYTTDGNATADYVNVRPRLAASLDGGQTWVTSNLTSQTTNMTYAQSFDFGEYMGLSLYNDQAFASWSGMDPNDPNDVSNIYAYTTTAAIQGAPSLVSAVSRMMQGAVGSFDIQLPQSGATGIECRSVAGGMKLVATFDQSIASATAAITSGVASVSGTPIIAGDQVIVNLASVADAQALVLTLSNVTNAAGQSLASTNIAFRVLKGDVNGDGVVSVADYNLVRSELTVPYVNSAQFRADVNLDGRNTAADALVVRSLEGHSVAGGPTFDAPPTIAPIAGPDYLTVTSGQSSSFVFAIGDSGSNPTTLCIQSVTSDNQSQMPNADISVSGTGVFRTFLFSPPAALLNTMNVNITIVVSDGLESTAMTFAITVLSDPNYT